MLPLTLTEDLKRAEQYLETVYKSADTKVDSETSNDVKYSKAYKKSKSRKSYYNEFNTLAMQWAYNSGTKPGDVKILHRWTTSVLLEATEGGYIELMSGNYSEMREELERLYSEKDTGIHGNLETLRSEKRRNLWDSQYDENRGYGSRDSWSIRIQGLQNNTTRDNEYLRSSDKGKSTQITTENETTEDGYIELMSGYYSEMRK